MRLTRVKLRGTPKGPIIFSGPEKVVLQTRYAMRPCQRGTVDASGAGNGNLAGQTAVCERVRSRVYSNCQVAHLAPLRSAEST